MRVISGKYRGKKLISPSDERVRPTTDRIKETVFNILQFKVSGARVLDLFSGSGALGIECVSRGAAEVIFADKSQDSLDLTAKNLNGIEGNYRIIPGDFLGVLKTVEGKFDIIFLDPPYDGQLGEIAIDVIVGLKLLADGGIIYFEHGSDKTFVPPTGYKTRTKVMGYTVAEFVSKKTIAMFAGSFDPITKGHECVIDEALTRFDEVVVACLVNPEKNYFFSSDERLALVNACIEYKKGCRAVFSENTAIDTAKTEGADVFVRGIRSEDDLPYENEMREYNLRFGIDTVFVYADGFENVSSTLAREQMINGDFHLLPSGAIMLAQQLVKDKQNN